MPPRVHSSNLQKTWQSDFYRGQLASRQTASNSEEDETTSASTPPTSPTTALKSQLAQFRAVSAVLRAQTAQQVQTQQAAQSQQASEEDVLNKRDKDQLIFKFTIAGLNGLSTAIEVGTAGFGLLGTFFVRMLTLGWYNLQMIYGGWMKKGKDPLIGPLRWDPLPNPFESAKRTENSISRSILVILADLALVTLFLTMLAMLMMPIFIIAGALGAIL